MPDAAALTISATSPARAAELRTEQHDGTFAIVPAGVLDDETVEQIRVVLTAAGGPEPVPVVVDLGDCVLQHHGPLVRLMETLGRAALGGIPLALSCRRLTGRQLLNRVRPPAVPVFASIGDAVQLRRFAELGYSPGWRGAAEQPRTTAKPRGAAPTRPISYRGEGSRGVA